MADDFSGNQNPKDPLPRLVPTDAGRVLAEKFGAVAHGFPIDAIINAGMTMVISGLRQAHDKRAVAEKRFDDVAGRAKALLLEQHYDALGRRKQGIFAFNQHIKLPPIKLG